MPLLRRVMAQPRQSIYLKKEPASMNIASLKEVVSAEEWQLRVDLAACYRLVACMAGATWCSRTSARACPGPSTTS
jgi:hypothetical protein